MINWKKVPQSLPEIIVWGGGDQCRVNKPILDGYKTKVLAIVDDTPNLRSPFDNTPILYGWDSLQNWLEGKKDLGFLIAIGNPYGHIRKALHEKLNNLGLKPSSCIDPSVLIRSDVEFGDGIQIMPQALIHNNCMIGSQCIINTKALVEHDCILGDGVEVGPGAVLCGRVNVGENTWIGAGATILPRVNVGKNSIIGAGSVVVSDIPDGVVAIGVPAKPMANKTTASHLFNKKRDI